MKANLTIMGYKPGWLTFDCYGTLIQWDEGLLTAVRTILLKQRNANFDAKELIHTYDKYEHELEQSKPYKSFRTVAGQALRMAMEQFGLACESSDIELLTSGISKMPPFPEVVGALAELKAQGFKLCIVSNTDDDVIAGNVAQMGGHIDRIITANQAKAYKPSRRIFEHAHSALGTTKDGVIHICASPHLDLVAARDMKFRCIWINRGTGRKPLPDYAPNQVFPALDRVPAFFQSIGWALMISRLQSARHLMRTRPGGEAPVSTEERREAGETARRARAFQVGFTLCIINTIIGAGQPVITRWGAVHLDPLLFCTGAVVFARSGQGHRHRRCFKRRPPHARRRNRMAPGGV